MSQIETDAFEASGNQAEVFISYVPEDLDFVTQLQEELDIMGIAAWFGEQNVAAGEQLANDSCDQHSRL